MAVGGEEVMSAEQFAEPQLQQGDSAFVETMAASPW